MKKLEVESKMIEYNEYWSKGIAIRKHEEREKRIKNNDTKLLKTFNKYLSNNTKRVRISSSYNEWEMIEYDIPIKYFNDKYHNDLNNKKLMKKKFDIKLGLTLLELSIFYNRYDYIDLLLRHTNTIDVNQINSIITLTRPIHVCAMIGNINIVYKRYLYILLFIF